MAEAVEGERFRAEGKTLFDSYGRSAVLEGLNDVDCESLTAAREPELQRRILSCCFGILLGKGECT